MDRCFYVARGVFNNVILNWLYGWSECLYLEAKEVRQEVIIETGNWEYILLSRRCHDTQQFILWYRDDTSSDIESIILKLHT